MFASRFARKAVGGYNRNGLQDDNRQGFPTNRVLGNSRSVPQWNTQNNNQEDSIHTGQGQYVATTKGYENTRLSRSGGNRRSYTSSSWKRQPTVRQVESAESVYPRGNSRSANKQLKLQPAVIGTNAFPAQSKTVPESNSPRNPGVNNQRRLSIVSEQPSDISSSFCYINQGNLAKPTGTDSRQLDISVFSPEPNDSLTDYCAYCLHRQQKFQAATHHCSKCGPFGRYMCQKCLRPHDDFTENHDVQSISGQKYRKKSEESESEEPRKNGTHPNFLRDVSVKTLEDDQSCQITGFCQLEDGTIVLTEMNNKAIKTLDCQTYRVMCMNKLMDYPMDICCIGDNMALVILYKSTIQYIRIDEDGDIELRRQKVLKHDCVCLAYCDGKIFVGSSKSLYIYDKNWTELDKITNDLFGEERIFSDQFSVAVSMNDDVTTVYIADENTGMTAIELTGNELTTTWKFKDCNSFKASGLCFDGSKNVLLSDRGSERLIKMNAEGMIMAILVDSKSGIQPLNLPFYNQKNNNLIVSLSGKDVIKVFDFNS